MRRGLVGTRHLELAKINQNWAIRAVQLVVAASKVSLCSLSAVQKLQSLHAFLDKRLGACVRTVCTACRP
jgi:hypothetical protein